MRQCRRAISAVLRGERLAMPTSPRGPLNDHSVLVARGRYPGTAAVTGLRTRGGLAGGDSAGQDPGCGPQRAGITGKMAASFQACRAAGQSGYDVTSVPLLDGLQRAAVHLAEVQLAMRGPGDCRSGSNVTISAVTSYSPRG